MYIWKYKNLTIREQIKAGKSIGVTPQWLCRICGRKEKVRKLMAYVIVKYIDENAEIEDFFDYVEKED